MKKNIRILPYIVLTLLYLILTIPVLYTTILLVGRADDALVIFFGFVNFIFLMKYFKGHIFLSFLLGFFVSSFTICFIYAIWWLFGLFSRSLNPTVFFMLISVILCIIISKKYLKIKNKRNVQFIILLPTIVLLICAINLKKTYPTKSENKNLITVQIKIINKIKMPQSGDTVEVRIWRQPLFGLKGRHELYKTTTNENGIANVQLSKTHNYHLFIRTKENKLDFLDINSEDLKKKKMFIIVE